MARNEARKRQSSSVIAALNAAISFGRYAVAYRPVRIYSGGITRDQFHYCAAAPAFSFWELQYAYARRDLTKSILCHRILPLECRFETGMEVVGSSPEKHVLPFQILWTLRVHMTIHPSNIAYRSHAIAHFLR